MNWYLAEEEGQMKLEEALKLFSPERKVIDEIEREARGASIGSRIGAALTRGRGPQAGRSGEETAEEAVGLIESRVFASGLWQRYIEGKSQHGDF